ncbi:MAG: cellulase family glycosylhydrolase [Actinomycetota bacterium]
MIRRHALLLIYASACVLIAGPASATAPSGQEPPGTRLPHLSVRDARVTDEHGRTVLLRSVNVNQLGDYFQGNPKVPSTLPFSRTDLERIAAIGFNSVRLLVHWSRLEPKPGVHDESYLSQIRQAVTWAGELGLYVVLDMHQDGWGKYVNTSPDDICPPPLSHATGWDGAPEWATYTDGLPHCKLQEREVSAAVEQAWQSFWLDRDGIQQHLIDTWAWLAGAFKSDPTVAGYDLLNEPNPGLTIPVNETVYLRQFHTRTLEAIRAAEKGGLAKIAFFEPLITWNIYGVAITIPWTSDPNIVYAPHIYLGSISMDKAILGQEIIPLRQGFYQAKREADVYGTTFWGGEWGSFGNTEADAQHLARYAALEDEFQVGGAFWQWKQACGDPHGVSWPDGAVPERSGNLAMVRCGDEAQPAGVEEGLIAANAKVLSRPYPRAFPGQVTFTSDPASLTVDIKGQGGADQGPLEVWIPGPGLPTVSAAGLAGIRVDKVMGGWILRARVTQSDWTLRATGTPTDFAVHASSGTSTISPPSVAGFGVHRNLPATGAAAPVAALVVLVIASGLAWSALPSRMSDK